MVAAAAPNSRIIGGAGTWVPPVEVELPPDDEPDEALLVELADEVELEPELLPVEPEEPKLDDPLVAPELVELEPLLAEDEADEADEALLPEEAELPEEPPELLELPDEPLEPLEPELPLEPWPPEEL